MPVAPVGAPLNIANGVREFARATPSALAVIDGDRRLTFGDLAQRAGRLANALLDRGLPPGSHVAVCLGNRLEYPEIACGIAMAGMIMVPLNPRFTPPEAAFILDHSESSAVLVDHALLGIVQPSLDRCPLVTLVLDGDGPDDYAAALAAASPTDPLVGVDEQSPF
jgi:long-chain acyl-CoA synthetase